MPEAISQLQTRIMLKRYQQQLLAARQLAKSRARLRLREGLPLEDPDPSVRRHEFVRDVARELYTSLIYTGSENPVVEDIRQELGRHIGQEVEFTYPPGEKLCIVGDGPEGKKPLSTAQQLASYNMLMTITRKKIDQSMLEKPRQPKELAQNLSPAPRGESPNEDKS